MTMMVMIAKSMMVMSMMTMMMVMSTMVTVTTPMRCDLAKYVGASPTISCNLAAS